MGRSLLPPSIKRPQTSAAPPQLRIRSWRKSDECHMFAKAYMGGQSYPPHPTTCSRDRVPHISLVFREMWDTTNLERPLSTTQQPRRKSDGAPCSPRRTWAEKAGRSPTIAFCQSTYRRFETTPSRQLALTCSCPGPSSNPRPTESPRRSRAWRFFAGGSPSASCGKLHPRQSPGPVAELP